MLTGYSTKAYQGMGDAYLLPAIAAIVLGGHQCSRGKRTVRRDGDWRSFDCAPPEHALGPADAEAGRQIIYGGVLLSMLLIYGRAARLRE